MRPTHRLRIGIALLAALAVAACESNPPLGPAGHGDFDVQVSWSPDHVHTLSEITFTVEITDHDGNPVTDFEAVALERRLEGEDTWREIELELAGDVYRGTYLFTTSGEYHLRVMAQEHGADEMEVLHEVHDPMHAGQAHEEVGSWRVEFESFPGHVHEGEEAALRFWVTEEDANGESQPVEGLAPEIHVRSEETGEEMLLDAEEHDPGVYEAHHVFEEAGDHHVGLHLTGPDGEPAEAGFQVPVAHAH